MDSKLKFLIDLNYLQSFRNRNTLVRYIVGLMEFEERFENSINYSLFE